jgi:hypothetical protein
VIAAASELEAKGVELLCWHLRDGLTIRMSAPAAGWTE